MRALYLTADRVAGSGGGQAVAKNELLALQEFAGGQDRVAVRGGRDERPAAYAGLDVPLIDDYLAFPDLLASEDALPDLVHCYSGTWTVTLAALKYAGQAREDRFLGSGGPVKITYTVPMHNRQETIAEYERLLGPGSYRFQHIKDPRLWKLFSRGISMADLVIVPSTVAKLSLLEEKLVPEDRIRIIPHGIDAASIPEKPAPMPEIFRIGYLGGVGTDKGLVYLIKAWGLCDFGNQEGDPELWLAGRGTEQLEPMIRKYAPGGRFRLLGYLDGPDQPGAFYDSISCYCQPSVTEAFGIEILEAMAHGRPVIASAGAGASEVGVDAIVPARDPEVLAGAMRFWRTDRASILDDKGWARQAIARAHTWDKIRARYLDLWRRLGIRR